MPNPTYLTLAVSHDGDGIDADDLCDAIEQNVPYVVRVNPVSETPEADELANILRASRILIFGTFLAFFVTIITTFIIAYHLGAVDHPPVFLGGSQVPSGLRCQEDEAIVLEDGTGPLCVNIEEIVQAGR